MARRCAAVAIAICVLPRGALGVLRGQPLFRAPELATGASPLPGAAPQAQLVTANNEAGKAWPLSPQKPPTVQQQQQSQQAPALVNTFSNFYNAHATGRGIWKWANALAAYERLFGNLAGHQVNLAEIGVQSGGSLLMWQSVLGAACHVYGLDINPQTLAFQDAKTTITIGDQGDPAMWDGFFTNTCHDLDILIDDGGHEPHQMLTTTYKVFPKLNPGGFLAIEDIHGLSYIDTFFKPAAAFFAQEAVKGQLASVHIYPFLLVARKAGVSTKFPASPLTFSGSSVKVDSFERMMQEVPNHRGGHIVLQNPAWGPFMTEQGLANFFSYFGALHQGVSWTDTPTGCEHTAAPVCKVEVGNSPMQAAFTGVHIFNTYVVVEVAATPSVIQAVRRGTDFLKY